MSAQWNVHLYAYDDLAMVRDAVATIPDGVPVHVCDGRYVDFAGESDLTAGLEAFCGNHPDAIYHAPDADRLPWGDPTIAGELRSSVAAKAQWVNYEVLPGDEWTCKLDSDERLQTVTVDWDALDARTRYCPEIRRTGERDCHIARLWQPQYWTVWIDDCLLPREVFPRDASIERLARVHLDSQYRPIRFAYREELRDGELVIDNVGADRPREYQSRRVAHLRRLGRGDRAEEVQERLD